MAATATFPAVRESSRALRFAPSLPDLFFALLLLAWFGRPAVWQALLGDGDTGWHIRTGDLILATGRVPVTDPFSFTRPGAPWYAWEWLSDVVFAGLHRWHGLEAVAAFAALAVCLWAIGLLCWLLHRGAGLWIATAVTLAAMSASSVHFLARPHLFSLLLLAPALWILDDDWRRPTARVWWLVPMAALWANLHAGFAGWLAILAMAVFAAVLDRDAAAVRRYSLLTALSALATLANPYGWNLHRHIAEYLASPWIMDHVQEFQSPRFRTENMQIFAAMLLAGLVCAALNWRQHGAGVPSGAACYAGTPAGVGSAEYSFKFPKPTPARVPAWQAARRARPLHTKRAKHFEIILVLTWAFLSLRSARHIPWFAVVAAPAIASACARVWSARAALAGSKSPVRILWDVSCDLAQRPGITAWLPVLGLLALLMALPPTGLADFPDVRFPAAAITANRDFLAADHRILTTDQWADYLLYRFSPRQRVFFDGRGDFYGRAIAEDYQTLLSCGSDWRAVIERYRIGTALLPLDWPLGQLLEREPGWRQVYRDRQAVLLVKEDSP